MNTPTHAVFNIAVLGRRSANAARLAALGGVLPDLPIFIFYFVDKFWFHQPEELIWSHDYFASAWQPVIDTLHSFPLILLTLALLWRLPWSRVLCASLLLHSALDFPFHHDDAHRHFFPFSDWRFASPISYWDPKHHGMAGALIELMTLLAASAALIAHRPSWKVRIPLGLLCAAQAAGFLFFALQ